MKQVLLRGLSVLLLFCVLCGTAYAENSFVQIDDNNFVKVTMPEEVSPSVTAMSVRIPVQGENVDPGNEFDFDGDVEKWSIQKPKYNAETNTLTLYIADAKPLFQGESATITLGQINSNFRVDPSYASKIEITVVSNGEEIDLEEMFAPSVPEQPETPDNSGSGGTGTPGIVPPDSSVPTTPQKPVADFSALDAAAAQAAQYQESAYTAESFAALKAALQQIQTLKADPNATAEQVEEARIALENAIGALVPVSTQLPGADNTGSSGSGSTTAPATPVPDATSSVGSANAGAAPAAGQTGSSPSARPDSAASGDADASGSSAPAEQDASGSGESASDTGASSAGSASSASGSSDSWNEDEFFTQREPASSAPGRIWILVALIAVAVIMLAAYYFLHIRAGRNHKGGSRAPRGRRRR